MLDEQDFDENQEIKAKQQKELKELAQLREKQQHHNQPTSLGKRNAKDRPSEDQLEIEAANRESMECIEQ